MEQVSQCIRKLHSKRQNVNDGEEVPAPIVEVQSMEADSSCNNKAQSTVNERMLDGDNLETHWWDGPPDHKLRTDQDSNGQSRRGTRFYGKLGRLERAPETLESEAREELDRRRKGLST